MKKTDKQKIGQYHYLIHDRVSPKDYPWRFIKDPYKVLVSEFMLHRTRAAQVVPVFKDFINDYPSIDHFINEDERIIFKKVENLGLFWRISGMIDAVITLYNKYGEIPLVYSSLISIKGIGPYIAGAVICFSSNRPMPLIDTNTVRVIGRVFGLDISGEARRRKEVKEEIQVVTPQRNPRRYYYSVIDIAHEICKIKIPKCDICPLNSICNYFSHEFIDGQ